ncbi:MAG: carbohydrate-binding protein [Myxococcota bacterium]
MRFSPRSPYSSVFLACLACCVLSACVGPPHGARSASKEQSSSGSTAANGAAKNEAYGWRNVTMLGGGFVTGVIFSSVERDLVYARTDVGGAYRLDPRNKSWLPITDMFGREQSNYLGIESLAADPVDASKVYMAVGTYSASWAPTGAILRSSDRGATWQTTEMTIKMGGNENSRSNGERLAIDPNKTNILYFGSRRNGLWKSSDGAVSFSQVASFPLQSDPEGLGVLFVTFDRQSAGKDGASQTIYAGVAKTDGCLFVSTDAGESWKGVPKQPMGLMASHAEFDQNGVLYLSYGNVPGPSDVVKGAVYKYNPKGNEWTNITPVEPGKDEKDKFGYGGLSVDAAHPGTLVVSTIDRWTRGDDIFRTTDGGKHWTPVGSKAEHDPAGARYLYWDHEKPSSSGWMGDIDIDPFDPAHVYYVTGQGIWGSNDVTQVDAGKPAHFSFQNRGLEETVVAHLISPPKGPPLLSSVLDLGGFRHDDLDVAPSRGMFQNPIFWSGSTLDFAQNAPEIVVRAGAQEAKKRGAYSLDSGATWTPFAGEPAGGNGRGGICVSADGKTFFWAERDAVPAFSRDRGKTWTPAVGLEKAAGTPDWAPSNLLSAADRVNPNKFYVYDSKGGRVFVSSDGGAHFSPGSGALPSLPDYQLTSASIVAVPGNEGDVWASAREGLFRSTDSGAGFARVSSVEQAHSVGFGAPAPGSRYPAVYLNGKVGGVDGFFRSNDQGESWVRINDDQHQFGGGNVIIGDPRVYGRVYLGTGGRGVLVGEPR